MSLKRRNKKDNRYRQLQEDTIRLIQEYSGKVWTDQNVHDPGITIADIVNYALYELEYQLKLPLQTYLSGKNRKTWAEIGLFTPGQLFDCVPVTLADYEELIEKTFPQIEACDFRKGEDHLYHILLKVKQGADTVQLQKDVKYVYHQYRNLGENLGSVGVGDIEKKRRVVNSSLLVRRKEPEVSGATFPELPEMCSSIIPHFPPSYGLIKEREASGQLRGYLQLYDSLLSAIAKQVYGTSGFLTLGEETKGIPQRQKSRYLDRLDILYGTCSRKWFCHLPMDDQNKKRGEFLIRFPDLQRDRFRAANLLGEEPDTPGIFRWISFLTGYSTIDRISVSDYLGRYHLRLLDDTTFFTRYKYLLEIDLLVLPGREEMEAVPSQSTPFREKDYHELYLQIHLLWHNILYESFLIYGTNIKNYHIIPRWGQGYVLLFHIPGQDKWLGLGQFFEKERVIRMANLLCSFLRSVTEHCAPFYLIEHTLLYAEGEQIRHPERMTFIFPRFSKACYRKELLECIILERLPTHLKASFLWLKQKDMQLFEKLYYSWREAGKKNNKHEYAILCRELRRFLSVWDK